MKYLQIIKQMEEPESAKAVHATTLGNEIDEIDELTLDPTVSISSISSISSTNDANDQAVATLRQWRASGALDRLPDPLPGFIDELAQYAERARLIGMVKAILDAVPWSLTAYERAEQFVTVLAPLIDGRAA